GPITPDPDHVAENSVVIRVDAVDSDPCSVSRDHIADTQHSSTKKLNPVRGGIRDQDPACLIGQRCGSRHVRSDVVAPDIVRAAALKNESISAACEEGGLKPVDHEASYRAATGRDGDSICAKPGACT